MVSVKEKRIPVTVNCEYCGKPKETIYPERTRFCDAVCSKKWHRQNHTFQYLRTCEVCGMEWYSSKNDARYCSDGCWGRAQMIGPYSISKALVLYTGPIVDKAPSSVIPPVTVVPSRSYVFKAGYCRRCGKSFITAKYALYCSDKCKYKDIKSRRRARLKNAYVEDVWRFRVMERDNWICYLCGQPIDKTAQVPHPLAATLEHVVSLANGGEHSMANVRAAHFICNSRKG